MAKQPVSVTLDEDNLLWLRGQTRARGHRSLSELLDRLVTEARATGDAAASRSVVGTIDIDASDPDLTSADAMIRSVFDATVSRPSLVRERAPSVVVRGRRKRIRGRE